MQVLVWGTNIYRIYSRENTMDIGRLLSDQSEAAHEFGALNTLLLVVVLGLCILSAYLIKQNNFYYLPESAAAILVGLVVGGLARLVYPSEEELQFLTFEPELFFFLLLPPIIFGRCHLSRYCSSVDTTFPSCRGWVHS